MWPMVRERLQARVSSADVVRLGSSLILALLLWGWVTTLEDPEVSKSFSTIGIEAPELPDTLQVVGALPEVTIRINGPESVVDDIVSTEVSARMNLDGVEGPGTYTVSLVATAPDGVWERQVVPSRLSITVEDTESRQLPIEWEAVDSSDGTRRLGAVDPEVSEVTVRGPTSVVDRVARVVLQIDISDQTGTFTDAFTPVAQDAEGQEIPEAEISPRTVFANVEVSARGKSVAVIPTTVGNPAQGYAVSERTANPLTVLVDGPPEVLRDLVAVSTEAIDVTDIDDDITRRVAIVDLPPGVQVIEPSDATVTVLVIVRQQGVIQSLPGQGVEATNLLPGLEAEIQPGQLAVIVLASEEELSQISSGDLHVQVDLRDLGPGTYTLMPRVLLPPNAQWVRTNPSTVTVTIRASGATPEPVSAASPSARLSDPIAPATPVP